MNPSPPRRRGFGWLGLTLTTVLSIGVTVGVGWYQVSRTRREAAQAELERLRSVKAQLVSIVEEHVLQETPIEVSRIARLTNARRRESRLTLPISVDAIIEEAEYNILNSSYLDFERKERYKEIFDNLYDELERSANIPFEKSHYQELLDEVALAIEKGYPVEALAKLDQVGKSFDAELKNLEARLESQAGVTDPLAKIRESPQLLGVFLLTYFIGGMFFARYLPFIRKMVRSLMGTSAEEGEGQSDDGE